MTDPFGHTRSVLSERYALITPPGLVRAPLPGWPGAACAVVISPAMGARFAQILVTLGPGAVGQGQRSREELFLYVRSGAVAIGVADQRATLTSGGYAYVPPGASFSVRAEGNREPAELLVFQRAYLPLAGIPAPEPVIGQEQDLLGAPFLGDEAALLKTLLPDTPAFDMAVNIFTFMPGATLPMVETHVMEHGLLMLNGQGIYRLASDWHPVQAGDVIWMAPFCPQWFVATGKTPARYIYYKDVNRDAL
ncbi:MAG: (S)-ureidoglycine aminohydrolase [Chloroflexi bacterium OHK40]